MEKSSKREHLFYKPYLREKYLYCILIENKLATF